MEGAQVVGWGQGGALLWTWWPTLSTLVDALVFLFHVMTTPPLKAREAPNNGLLPFTSSF